MDNNTGKVNPLTIRSAEAMALELDERGEKWAAQTIVSLLAIIEDLTPKESLREGFADWEYKPVHTDHPEGEWFYACEACSGLPEESNELTFADRMAGRSMEALEGKYPGATAGTLLVRIENADPLRGRYSGGFWWPKSQPLAPGNRIEHQGISGTITHVDDVSNDSDLVVLVDWDEKPV